MEFSANLWPVCTGLLRMSRLMWSLNQWETLKSTAPQGEQLACCLSLRLTLPSGQTFPQSLKAKVVTRIQSTAFEIQTLQDHPPEEFDRQEVHQGELHPHKGRRSNDRRRSKQLSMPVSPWACLQGACRPGYFFADRQITLIEQSSKSPKTQTQLKPVTRAPASLTQETHRRQVGLSLRSHAPHHLKCSLFLRIQKY